MSCDQRSINQVSCMCLGTTDTIQFQMTLRAKKKNKQFESERANHCSEEQFYSTKIANVYLNH